MKVSEGAPRAEQVAEQSQDFTPGSHSAPGPSAAEVVMTLIATAHRLRRALDMRLSSQPGLIGLSGPRLRLLLAVEEAGRPRMGDLAADLGITARTVTTLVDALEKEGLLVRLPDPADRRATLLAVTDRARTQFEQVRSVQLALGEDLVAPLNQAQRRQLLALLTRLNRGVLGEVGEVEDDIGEQV
jgi:DNA-binding MarR family transcriptional regulator